MDRYRLEDLIRRTLADHFRAEIDPTLREQIAIRLAQEIEDRLGLPEFDPWDYD
jgi:hypothetical protein